MIATSGRFEFIAEVHGLVKADVETHLKSSLFDYIDFEAAEVIHALHVGFGGWVAVIGNPENGSYEWVWRSEGGERRLLSSNQGWGCPESALREALKVAMEA
ncbi:hypothetical protein SH661x_000403 [Planctomicrobium sp. SH661]|uniref:hypothetical protein n=1 Tax=Planctomicrobium sp. SH661 TaxID=3448124 RepID=UPI003F5C0195